MIGSLRGEVLERWAEGTVLVDVGGVGYEVIVSARTFGELEPTTPAFLYVHHHIREDDQTLYGFLTRDERSTFKTLIATHGVGPALAMAILATYPPVALVDVVAKGDFAALKAVPGVGPKTAQRLTYHLLRAPDAEARALAAALIDVRDKVVFCGRCFNISDQELCAICRDGGRDQRRLCVVEEPLDVLALERTAEFKGLYHVLHGAISPIDGIGPERLRIRELLERADEAARDGTPFEEVILATNPTLEGEATAMYLAERLESVVGSVTRIARGLPVGGDLEYADEVTLIRALQGRRAV
jgi:recombination protein RecR